ncbi:MFS transporter [Alkalihalobacillus sp. AL-G]|uniref:MFS transporter n=1 Tax=Alkalihalobacillus sp. AL-G TaxID=2926399 RepID=UPI00272D9D99|nr:MFS transporter [Alkalihalobacillus sp. AL-G]WLD92622.1 MFS transporter [Alkalihalobacillus sp. AL-G]
MEKINTFPLQGFFALQSTSFRRFLYGSFLIRTSEWMDLTILNWVVYQWTNSPLMLGLLNACRLLPIFFFSLPAGILADRFDRLKMLTLAYFGLCISTFLIAMFVQEKLPIFWLLTAITVRSFLSTIEVPIRNAFLSDLVPKSMLANGIAIQTTIINLSRIIGPALAGVLLVHSSPGILMYFVSLGSLFAMISLFLIQPIEQNGKSDEKQGNKESIKETFRYIDQNPKVLSVLLIAIAPMVFGFPYTTMLPIFSKELLGMGPDGFGLLLSVSSVGAIVSTILLSIGQPNNSRRLLVLSALGFGTGLCFFTLFNHSYTLILLFMFLIGLASQFYRTLSRVVLQLNVSERYRGRVLSIALMDRGYIPLGALIVGWVGSSFGAYSAGLFMGLGCILSTLCITLLRKNLWNGQE